jgi:hypothetical protein
MEEKRGEDKTEYQDRRKINKSEILTISIQLTNPLPIPLTQVTVRMYGVGVSAPSSYSPPDSLIPAHATVRWLLNVTLTRPAEEASPNPEESTSRSNVVNNSNVVIPSKDKNSRIERKTAIFGVVNSIQISRIDGFVLV